MLTEQFLQENVPLRHLLNEETLLMCLQRSAIKEVNDWTLNVFQSSIINFKCTKIANCENKMGEGESPINYTFGSLFSAAGK